MRERRPATRTLGVLAAVAYVVAAAALAGLGFTAGSTVVILVGALMTMPASLLAMPAYYLVYGVLSQLPGANPSQSSGSVTCAVGEACQSVTSGDPSAWFTQTTEMVGVAALVLAALLNLVGLRLLLGRRRTRISSTA